MELDRDTTLRLIENNVEVYWPRHSDVRAGNADFILWATDNGRFTIPFA
jgi:hypothetical protein